MQLQVWNPLREMEDMFSQLSRGFGRPAATANKDLVWAPAVDITESDKEYVVKAELPGVNKDDAKVTVENGVLTLSGERRYEKDEKGEKTHRSERFYGSYARSFTVPDDVLTDKIAAEHKDGVLTVHLPKTDIKKSSAKQIEVK